MKQNRRSFLHTSAALMGGLMLPRLASAAPATLSAREAVADLGVEGVRETRIWGYDGLLPGPMLRVKQGERLSRRFLNQLPLHSTVHWHGIRIDSAMDGVPGLSQEPVAPGDTFDYDFVLPDAGTYWYHPHNYTSEQLARGLYGPLIVDEASPPEVDRDEVLMIDDWRLDEAGQIHDGSFSSVHDRAHGGRLGNWVTVNGQSLYSLELKRHERVRFRLVNAANARILRLGFLGAKGWVVALDGMPLETPAPLAQIVLAPAQRADVIVDVDPAEEPVVHLYAVAGQDRLAIASFPVVGDARPARLDPPSALPANPVAPLDDLLSAKTVPVVMGGGAMGGLQEAIFEGEKRSLRDLAGEGLVWAMNGVVFRPKEPLFQAKLGEIVRLALVNDTAWPHGMHVHGHHFREVMADGSFGPLRDTILVDVGEKKDIAFVADNPGKWLFHCHMVEHAAGGMSTWFTVG